MLYHTDCQWYRTSDAYEASDKGIFQGSCNRSCCQAPHTATYYNQSTQAYYCFRCAALLNEYPSAKELRSLRYNLAGLCISDRHPEHPEHGKTAPIPEELDKLVLGKSRLIASLLWYNAPSVVIEELRNALTVDVPEGSIERWVTPFYKDRPGLPRELPK